MLELRIAEIASRVYIGIIRLCMRSVNARDKWALRKLDAQLRTADKYAAMAQEYDYEAQTIETDANAAYDRTKRKIDAAYNLLRSSD